MQQTILITGASRGLGKALALRLAKANIRLLLWARSKAALDEVAARCAAQGADVETLAIDLVDTNAIEQATQSAGVIDVVYVNAGLFDGARSPNGMEELESELATIDVNLRSAIALVNTAVRPMRERGSGHIVFISSLAATFPLADAAAYSASKAGLSAYAESLRQKLGRDGIKITDVQPGHISTDMASGHDGPLPMIVSADKAAKLIVAKVEAGKSQVSFPWPLNWGTWMSQFLPAWARSFIAQTQRFTIKND
ncbi:MAG: SDR family NAD(P)-dependent oxidoreductase [Hyphomicrobiales bacterium]